MTSLSTKDANFLKKQIEYVKNNKTRIAVNNLLIEHGLTSLGEEYHDPDDVESVIKRKRKKNQHLL